MNLLWKYKQYSELNADEVYDILRVRQAVFVIEQQCIYEDCDEFDATSIHILGEDDSQTLAAYARLLPPGTKYVEAAIGRILTTKQHRSLGLGKKLMTRCIEECKTRYPGSDIRISAQVQLQNFYGQYGFVTDGESYDDAGIEHIDMLLKHS